jgi:hypothetical protein
MMQIVEISDVLVFYSELTQLIALNMSVPFIAFKESILQLLLTLTVQIPNLMSDAME